MCALASRLASKVLVICKVLFNLKRVREFLLACQLLERVITSHVRVLCSRRLIIARKMVILLSMASVLVRFLSKASVLIWSRLLSARTLLSWLRNFQLCLSSITKALKLCIMSVLLRTGSSLQPFIGFVVQLAAERLASPLKSQKMCRGFLVTSWFGSMVTLIRLTSSSMTSAKKAALSIGFCV